MNANHVASALSAIGAKHGAGGFTVDPQGHFAEADDQRPPAFTELHELAGTKDWEALERMNHCLIDAIEELQAQHVSLRNEFERLRETSVPMVTDAMRRAGRFLRKGKHARKPHEWVVIADMASAAAAGERVRIVGAAAWAALKPTTEWLQASALQLVHRMIEAA
jgi:hypothetical protein